jgi:hypothetical protein
VDTEARLYNAIKVTPCSWKRVLLYIKEVMKLKLKIKLSYKNPSVDFFGNPSRKNLGAEYHSLITNALRYASPEWLMGEANQYGGVINPLDAKLYTICHLLALLGAHPTLHISRIRVKVY